MSWIDTKTKSFDTLKELEKERLFQLGILAGILNNTKYEPIEILDLATGPNKDLHELVKRFSQQRIAFNLLLTDISPMNLPVSYNALQEHLTPAELKHVAVTLADITDFNKEITKPYLKKSKKTIQKILSKPKFHFLNSTYECGKRTIDFSTKKFDLITGDIPYSSLMNGLHEQATQETIRLLSKQGVVAINEMQILEKSPFAKRTKKAHKLADIPHIENAKANLGKDLNLIVEYTCQYGYHNMGITKEQAMQEGDLVKRSFLVYGRRN